MNPVAHFIFPPGLHTVALTVTNSGGQKSTSKFGVDVGHQLDVVIPDGGQGDCKPTYDNGNVHIIAECIQTLSGGGYVIETHQLDLNGIVLAPKNGGYGVFKILPFQGFGIGGGTHLSGPGTSVELLNTPIGDMALGGLDLASNPIQLTFQAYKPPPTFHFGTDRRAHIADDENKTLLMSLGVGKDCTSGNKDPSCCPSSSNTACARLPGGFPLMGLINVYLNNKGQSLFDVQVGLNLTAVNFQATGALEVVADPVTGINLNSLTFSIQQAGIADVFTVKDASFVYYFPSDPDPTKRDTWQAKGTLIFGPLSQPSLAAELDFKQGQFSFASMVFTAPSGTGVPIYPGILLNQLGGSIGVNPLQFGGQLGASIAETLELSLAFKYREATDTQLGFFGGQGQLSYQDDKIATLAADVYSDGYTDAQLSVDLHFPFDSTDPVVKVGGNIGFWDEPTSGRWEADGSVNLKLWVISAEVAGLINNQYIAGCADISGFGVQGRYRLADGNIDGGLFGFSNCSDQLKQYKETPVTPHSGGFVGSAADGRGGGLITLPGGTNGQELQITSNTGTPIVTITGPDHRTFTTAAAPGLVSTSGGVFISAIAPDHHRVLVFLRHPAGGKWNIQPTTSSAAISTVRSAQEVPPATVRLRVRHVRGHTWALSYRIANYVPGTAVQLVERGRDSTHVLGSVKQASGVLRFVPEDALGRSRTIVAYLRTTAGAPLRTLSAGHYTAPAAERPGRVRRARFVRQGTNAQLTWTAAPGTRLYNVVIRGSDGRLESLLEKPHHTRVTLTHVLSSETFRATVTPEGGPNLLPGRGALARLRATAPVVVISCTRGGCTQQSVTGTLVLRGAHVHATLRRGHTVYATGIASATKVPTQLGMSVSRRLRAGRYTLVLSYRGSAHTTQIRLR